MTVIVRRRNHRHAAAIAAYTIALVWFAWWRGARHDYVPYLDIWASARAGDPWVPLNTYGPLFVVFSSPAGWWWFLPKLMFVGSFAVVGAWLSVRIIRSRPSLWWFPLLVFVGHTATIELAASFGLNDALVAALVAAAAMDRSRERLVRCGVLLGLAALLKFYPLVLALFMAAPFRRRAPWLPMVIASGVTVGGLVIGWAVTGPGVFDGMVEGSERGPKLLSILSAAATAFTDGMAGSVVEWLIDVNSAMVALAAVAIAVVAQRCRWSWEATSLIGYAVVLTVYKVGHPQFWLPWLLLTMVVVVVGGDEDRRLVWWCIPQVIFLWCFQAGYWWTGGYWTEGLWVRTHVGFVAPIAALAGPAIWAVTTARRRRALPASGAAPAG